MTPSNTKPPIAIIGVPTNSSGTDDGVAKAPAAYREAGIINALARYGTVYDTGDITFTPPQPIRDVHTGMIAPDTFFDMVASVGRAVSSAFDKGHFPLVLGGDCGLILGCLQATKHHFGQPGLLFVDGHEDAYPPHDSPTGESADMELGFALGRHSEQLPDAFTTHLPLISVDDVALLGIRDTDVLAGEGVPSLRHLLPVMMIEADEIMQGNSVAITRSALTHIGADSRRWWLHTDLDVLSTDALPAVDYQQPGGLSWEVLTTITKLAVQQNTIAGWDITIYNPDMDADTKYVKRIIQYIEAVVQVYFS